MNGGAGVHGEQGTHDAKEAAGLISFFHPEQQSPMWPPYSHTTPVQPSFYLLAPTLLSACGNDFNTRVCAMTYHFLYFCTASQRSQCHFPHMCTAAPAAYVLLQGYTRQKKLVSGGVGCVTALHTLGQMEGARVECWLPFWTFMQSSGI